MAKTRLAVDLMRLIAERYAATKTTDSGSKGRLTAVAASPD
jgi:hypothetical protein